MKLALILAAMPLILSAAELKSTDYPSISVAIAACAEKGGGRVVVPRGLHETGPVHLKSNVELHFEDGAKLLFSDDLDAYRPGVPVSWNGIESLNYSPLLYAYGVTNAAVTGRGLVSARLAFWLKWRDLPGRALAAAAQIRWSEQNAPMAERDLTAIEGAGTRPHVVHLNRCKDVTLDGFSIKGSPFWTVHVFLSQDIVVRNLDVDAWSEDGLVLNNSDGCDIECSRNVLVENCTFSQNDDAIVIKSGREAEGRRRAISSEDIVIRNCTVRKAHTLVAIGSEVSGGIRNVRLENCRVTSSVNALVFVKTNPRRGGFIENITVDGVEAKRVDGDAIGLMTRWYYGQPPGEALMQEHPEVTRIRGIHVRNVRCDWVKRFVTLLGDPNLPPQDVVLENVIADEVFERFSKIKHMGSLKLDVTARKIWPDTQW